MSELVVHRGPMSGPVAQAAARPAVAVTSYLPWLLGAYLVGRMFMVFDSGLPQPADVSLAVLLAVYLRPGRIAWMQRHVRHYFAFVVWVSIVNGVWAVLRLEAEYVMPIAYFWFNLCLTTLVATTRVRHRETFDWIVRSAILVAAAIQAALALADGGVFRMTGTFNNPNQLAIWSICLAGTYLVVRRPDQLVRDAFVLGLLTFCQFITTSRAGVVGFLVLSLAWLYDVSYRSRYRFVVLAAVVAVVAVAPAMPFVLDYIGDLEVVARLDARFDKEGSLDEVGLRNTDRITRYYQYAVLGAGEGDFERFPYSLPIEIHSTFGTVLFSYGLPGAFLFGAFVISLVRRLAPIHQAVLGAMFLYATTHNGLRFSFFWFTLGMLIAEAASRRARAPKGGSPAGSGRPLPSPAGSLPSRR